MQAANMCHVIFSKCPGCHQDLKSLEVVQVFYVCIPPPFPTYPPQYPFKVSPPSHLLISCLTRGTNQEHPQCKSKEKQQTLLKRCHANEPSMYMPCDNHEKWGLFEWSTRAYRTQNCRVERPEKAVKIGTYSSASSKPSTKLVFRRCL